MKTESTFRELITDHKQKTKWRQSIFIITINTNKSYNSRSQETINKMPLIKSTFEDLLHNLFSQRNLIKIFSDLGKPPNKIGKPLLQEYVQDINAETQIEVNTEGRGFLHSHTTIKVIHDTRVQVNIPLVRTVVQKKMASVGVKPCVMVKGLPTTYQLEEYVR